MKIITCICYKCKKEWNIDKKTFDKLEDDELICRVIGKERCQNE